MKIALDSGKHGELVDLDIEFHETIINLAVERTVIITWSSIVNQIRLHFSKNLRFQYDHIVDDHHALLDSFKTKDADIIQNAISKHLDSEDNLLCLAGE